MQIAKLLIKYIGRRVTQVYLALFGKILPNNARLHITVSQITYHSFTIVSMQIAKLLINYIGRRVTQVYLALFGIIKFIWHYCTVQLR